MSHPTIHHYTDQQLVTYILEGNQHAFSIIIQRTEGLVAQMVYKMIPHPGDRKDIAQDVYLKAFKALSTFRFQSKLSTWIGKITYNTCLHYIEKKHLKLLDELPDEHVPEQEILSAKELSTILHSAVSQLSPVYRTLITLYHQEELSYAEIGEITSLPAGTVKNYLFRARKALKVQLLSTYKKEEL